MSATVPPTTPTEPGVKTFRGESLEELLPQIRAELGPDAVILRQRDGLKGGVGGFFQKRCVEVDARAGTKRIDTYAGADEAQARAALDEEASEFRQEFDALAAQFDAELHAALSGGSDGAEEARFSRPPAVAPSPAATAFEAAAPAPAATAFPASAPFAAAAPFPTPDAAIAEGLQAPAIRAMFEAAAPFAEQLERADAALPPVAAPVAASLPAPTAAPAPAAVPAAPAPPVAAVELESGPARPAAADTQELALVEGGLSPALAAEVVAETVSHLLPFGTPRQLKRLVRSALARRIPVPGPRALGGGAIAFAGAGGSGKTLTAARLAAAYAARSDLDVVVLALRPRDGGAELRGLLAPTGVTVVVADTAAQAKARLEEASDRTLVIIDTPALSPGDEEAVRALASELRRLKGVELHLCMPATLSAAAAARLLAALRPLRPSGMVLTHVDETPQVGAVVELSIAGGPPLMFVGRDTQLEGGLALADPAAVAALVLP